MVEQLPSIMDVTCSERELAELATAGDTAGRLSPVVGQVDEWAEHLFSSAHVSAKCALDADRTIHRARKYIATSCRIRGFLAEVFDRDSGHQVCPRRGDRTQCHVTKPQSAPVVH